MDFVFTEAFQSTYDSLSDDDVVPIDVAIRRLLVDHATGWARLGRIEGERGGAWSLTAVGQDLEPWLYWDYYNDDTIILLALMVRR